ncbi:MAG TPA: ATP-binding protein [Campylobacterales bacterium]|nr:ATP-binding protein [Campylobacterales bacterium]
MDKSEIYEKLGLFYLGNEVDIKSGEKEDELLLVKNKNLTTHATIIGMTGSGKTGLGISMIEEAVLDNIPSIIIDPKGDMGNLLLAFDDFDSKKFEPWVDSNEANKQGLSVEEFAKKEAMKWEKGLNSAGQDRDRVKRFKDKADITIYTPGSSAGVSLSVLSSFDAPSLEILEDSDTFSYLLNSTVSSILALIGEDKDMVNSKEAILLSNIFNHFWRKNRGLNIEELIGYIANPPFTKIGVIELKTFYPQNDRLKLAFSLNNIIASPTFSSWLEGVTLDIDNLLYGKDAKPKVSILNIAHLNDNERMFFVTLFLNKYISWMRMQGGSSSLKTLLYMDEIFGFFPATSNPPSKSPMLLLLKQARAFGVGIVLSTQNPIDLDYKGLSNIGSWFIGRLQTKQDIDRVINGLIKSGSDLTKKDIEELLANLQKRTFLLKSAHRDDIDLFSTRWVISYLKGPLSRDDIKLLMKDKKELLLSHDNEEKTTKKDNSDTSSSKPILNEDISEYFYNKNSAQTKPTLYPHLIANATLRYYNAKRAIDEEERLYNKYELPSNLRDLDWNESQINEDDFDLYELNSTSNASFANLPNIIKEASSLKELEKDFTDYLYQNNKLTLYRVSSLKLESDFGENLDKFKIKINDTLSDKKEENKEKLIQKFEKKRDIIDRRYQRALVKLEKEEEDVSSKTTGLVMSIGMAILDSFLGTKRVKRSTISKAGTAIRGAGRIYGEKADVKRAKEALKVIEEDLQELEYSLEDEILKLDEKFSIDSVKIEEFFIKPRRSDIYDVELAILWESR